MVEKGKENKDVAEKDEKKEVIKAKIKEEKGPMEKSKTVAERMFEDILGNIKEMQQEVEKRVSEYASSLPAKPSMDVMETEESIIIKTDLPGVNKDDININLTEDSIDIKAKFEEESEVSDANFIKKERKYGEAQRSMVLPSKIKVKEASAKFDNGILTVELPKVEKAEKFKVDIN
ncbi:MAG: Hsp20/alpha crystallin family protein [Methanobacteriaceae archaeon]|nr:Hsp20/alpha crystallin family protein [Methanobacteriaceae archaeon]